MANSQPSGVPHLSDADISVVLGSVSIEEIANLMRRTFEDLGRGGAATTERVRAVAGGHMASAMAAALPAEGVTGGKLYSTVDGRFTFLIALFSLSGELMCTMDGAAITEARTPALSAVAIADMAATDAVGAAVIGTGRECIPHLKMLAGVVPGPLRLWGRDHAAVAARCVEAAALGITVDPSASVASAVNGCDVVVTLTSADEPVLRSSEVTDRMLICAVGATKPQRCELDPAIFARAAEVVTDSVTGAQFECGDLIHAVDADTFEWSRLVGLSDALGKGRQLVRAGIAGPVVFETQGVAAQDVAMASLVWRRWQQR